MMLESDIANENWRSDLYSLPCCFLSPVFRRWQRSALRLEHVLMKKLLFVESWILQKLIQFRRAANSPRKDFRWRKIINFNSNLILDEFYWCGRKKRRTRMKLKFSFALLPSFALSVRRQSSSCFRCLNTERNVLKRSTSDRGARRFQWKAFETFVVAMHDSNVNKRRKDEWSATCWFREGEALPVESEPSAFHWERERKQKFFPFTSMNRTSMEV